MARFSIRDMLLVTALVALATGWLVERRQLDFARINAETEAAMHQAERAKVEALWKQREGEFRQLMDALGEHGVQVGTRNGRVLVSPDSAFADDPLKVEVPANLVATPPTSPSLSATVPHTDSPPADVREVLAEKYPASDVIREDGLQFEPNTPIERVELPALAKALPDVRFITTELRTGYYEYPQVSVAVAVPKQGKVAVYLSPTYSKSEPAFTKILLGARVPDASEERAVADEIARLFAMITYKGEIKEPRHEKDRYSADLWHNTLLWRRLSIQFANGRVSSVALTNPKDAAE
jgi:hypothetical protein